VAGVRIDGVIFDLDGTIVDHRGSVVAALRGWLPGLGASLDEDLLAAWLAAERRHFPDWQARRIAFAEQRRRRLRDFLPLIGHRVGDDEQLDSVFTGYLAWYERSWIAFDDVAGAVRTVTGAGVPIAVLTNGTAMQQNAKIAKIGWAGKLGPVLTAEDLGVAKPDPEAFLAVCCRLGLSPGHVLHLGDQYDLDVVAAREAGLQALDLDRNGTGPHDESERITTLDQLGPYLERC
jgi:putative hydrolase of the HAD superfamily